MTLKRFWRVPLGGLGVARRRRAVEEVEVVRAVLDAVAQHVDRRRACVISPCSRARNFCARVGPVVAQVERLDQVGLRGAQEGAELDEIDAVFAVVVLRIAADPAAPP